MNCSGRRSISRRRFMAATATGLAAPLVVPGSILGKNGEVAPSERVAMGFIGLGNRGLNGMKVNFGRQKDVEIVGICDPCDKRFIEQYGDDGGKPGGLEAGREFSKLPASKTHRDFRELLARDDVDAVQIAVGERWHAVMSAAAARAGKHVYCEKPLALSVEDGKNLRKICQGHKTVFQFGTQQRSMEKFRFPCELVRNGRIGKLHTVKIGVFSSPSGGRTESDPVPEGLDFDLWTGPSEMLPYRRDIVGGVPPHKSAPNYFHYVMPYAHGFIHNWGIHHLDTAQWAMDTEHTGPVEVEGKGVFPTSGLCTSATSWDVEMRYESGIRLIYTDNLDKDRPDFPATSSSQKDWDWQQAGVHPKNKQGILFEGSEGWIFISRRDFDAHPKSLLTSKIGPDEFHFPKSPLHERNFLDAVKTGSPTLSPVEVAVRSDTLCHLSVIATRLPRKLKWDPKKERFKGDVEANNLLSCHKRGTWVV